jgi:hypothetical protein
MATSATYRVDLTLTEVIPAAQAPGAANEAARTVAQSGMNTATVTLNSGSTPPVTCGACFVAGTGDLDLTALDGLNDKAVDGSGLRVQFARFKNPSTNANPITIQKASANGYDGFGAGFLAIITPGGEVTIRTADAGGNISGTNKGLTVTATGAQTLECEIVMG